MSYSVGQDPDLERKLRIEGFLKNNHKITAPLLIAFMLGLFVLPWVLSSFLVALGLQILGIALLYAFGKYCTTAFDKDKGGNPIFTAPKAGEGGKDSDSE